MYKFTESGLIDLDGVVFVSGCGNRFDNEYQDWIAAGNTPLPYEPTPTDRKAELIAQIAALDFKLIRPMAEGDIKYLTIINSQIKALRDELKTL